MQEFLHYIYIIKAALVRLATEENCKDRIMFVGMNKTGNVCMT